VWLYLLSDGDEDEKKFNTMLDMYIKMMMTFYFEDEDGKVKPEFIVFHYDPYLEACCGFKIWL